MKFLEFSIYMVSFLNFVQNQTGHIRTYHMVYDGRAFHTLDDEAYAVLLAQNSDAVAILSAYKDNGIVLESYYQNVGSIDAPFNITDFKFSDEIAERLGSHIDPKASAQSKTP